MIRHKYQEHGGCHTGTKSSGLQVNHCFFFRAHNPSFKARPKRFATQEYMAGVHDPFFLLLINPLFPFLMLCNGKMRTWQKRIWYYVINGLIKYTGLRPRRVLMPIFEYTCQKCDHEFEMLVRNTRQKIKCPGCRSTKTSKKFSVFGMKTSKGNSASSSSASCSSCSSSSCTSCSCHHWCFRCGILMHVLLANPFASGSSIIEQSPSVHAVLMCKKPCFKSSQGNLD